MSKQLGKKFGAAVQRIRKGHGLTQSGLAKKAGLHTTFLSGIEKGDRNVTLDTASKIARALGISMGELFVDEQGLKSPSAPAHVTFLKLGGTWDMQVTKDGLTGEGQLDDKSLAELERRCGYDERKILDEVWQIFEATTPIEESIAGHLPWVATLGSLVEGDFLPLFAGDSSHYRPALLAPALAFILRRMQAHPDTQVLAGMGTDTVDVVLPFLDAFLFDKQGTLPVLFSGANVSFREKDSDAPQNFRDLALATRLPLQSGAYYVFNRTIYRGGDFVKVDPDEDPADLEGQITFFSPHRTQARIGFLGEGTVRIEREGARTKPLDTHTPPAIFNALNAIVTINLGDENNIDDEVQRILDSRYTGVIIASHALGNAPFPIRRATVEAAKMGKLVLNVSRCVTGNTNERYYVSLSSVNARELKGTSYRIVNGGRISARAGKALLTRAILEGLGQKEASVLVSDYVARSF